MITQDMVPLLFGDEVYDANGEKIGKVGQVYLDDETGQPAWVTVRTGLFGMKESFVPLDRAELDGDVLRVPVPRDAVREAPRVDAVGGHLSPEEEEELYRYYGMPYQVPQQEQMPRQERRDEPERGRDEHVATGTTEAEMSGPRPYLTRERYREPAPDAGTGPGNIPAADSSFGGVGGAGVGGGVPMGFGVGGTAAGPGAGDVGAGTGGDVGGGTGGDAGAGTGGDLGGTGAAPGGGGGVSSGASRIPTGAEPGRTEQVPRTPNPAEQQWANAGVGTGRLRLRRYVIVEEQQVSIPVRREVVRVEFEPDPAGGIGAPFVEETWEVEQAGPSGEWPGTGTGTIQQSRPGEETASGGNTGSQPPPGEWQEWR